MSTQSNDLTIDGSTHAPISLQKFLDKQEHILKDLTLLIDGTGNGIAKDALQTFYITAEGCKDQAEWFLDNVWDGKRIPTYLYRYLSYMYDMKEYKSEKDLLKAVSDGKVTFDTAEYLELQSKLKWAKNNPELMQLIGLIQGFGGCLSISKKEKKYARVYIEFPETFLHPKRERKVMSMFNMLKKDYGFK